MIGARTRILAAVDLGRLVEDLGVVAAAAGSWAAVSAYRVRRRAPTSVHPSVAIGPPALNERQSKLTLAAVPPERLPTFASVGGMEALKTEVRDTFGLVLAHADEADAYRIQWNGLLLFGPPGVGKSFFARAVAGEFKLNFIPVATADLVSEFAGLGPHLVEQVFAFAKSHEPALLLFDEFDAVAENRRDAEGHASRDTLLQLLQSVEASREDRHLIVVAATNDLDALDPSVIRPGRFDRHVRIDVPDTAARAAIFQVALAGRPVAKDIKIGELAARCHGKTPAAITSAVDAAALAAFRMSAGTGRIVRISNDHLVDALDHSGGRDRPTIEDWSWARIVLQSKTLAELREIQAMVEDPDRCRRFGVDQPTGILLTGPPGTGKTTIAKVLAAEAACSFYPVSGADVTSRWVGESERLIARLFHRARDNTPSIVFIDEVDAIAGARGELRTYDRQLDQLLQEIDGMAGQTGVLVVGATNRPDRVDPALVRGGRLSRTIEIPLPDVEGRLAILELMTAPMPLRGVDLEELALETDGFSGADLKALCQQSAVEAMIRAGGSHAEGAITGEDMRNALLVESTAVANQAAPPRPSPPGHRRPLRAEGR